MWVNRHKYFRWTGRTAGISFAYMVAFPAFIGWIAFTTDVSILNGRVRGRMLMRIAGKMGYERQTERGCDCGVLGDWEDSLGWDGGPIVHMEME